MHPLSSSTDHSASHQPIRLGLKTLAYSLILSLATVACEQKRPQVTPSIQASEAFPGGDASVSSKPFPSFMLPVGNLPAAQRPNFYAGKALANQPWIKAPTITTARDGLGPIYNARTCLACHINGGKGLLPDDGGTDLRQAFVRISLASAFSDTASTRQADQQQTIKIHGALPEPMYGHQLQSQSVALFHQLRGRIPLDDPSRKHEVPPEAYVYIDWQPSEFIYPDGQHQSLRTPLLRITNLGYGKLHPKTLFSLRNAPAIHGVGLLELIDQGVIEQKADPDDADKNGISGRVNQVWDFDRQKNVAGRFGWKANRANLRIVTAAAFAGDVGITNPLFPNQPCMPSQRLCRQTPNGNDASGVELPEHLLQLVVNFTRNLGVPTKRMNLANKDKDSSGRELFYQIGCSNCHVPSYITQHSESLPHLGAQHIWPYTDLLLHDMGPGLADGRPDYTASGSEWRTAPLWGSGLNTAVNGSKHWLHDGRARSIEEAILWHGGEAEASKQAFAQLPLPERQSLIQFVKSL